MKKIFTYILAIGAFAIMAPSLYADEPSSTGIHLTKTVDSFNYNTFEGVIKLESFVEGSVKITSVTQPQDIVLVLDVSSSMSNNISSYTYTARGSQQYTYGNYGNNTYYYLDEDGNYYQVRRANNNPSGYSARSSQGYTYNGYGNNTYYYKDGDGYYPVIRETLYSKVENDGGYSYNSLQDKTYYVLYNNNYYQVYRGRTISNRYLYITINNRARYLEGTQIVTNRPEGYNNDDIIWRGDLYQRSYVLYYEKDGTRYYLSGTGVTTTAPINVTTDGATIWTGVLYSSQNNARVLYYEKNGTRYYLSGTTVTTAAPTDVTTDNGPIWTGVLFTRSSTSQSKLSALKTAAKAFIDRVYTDATENSTDHKISIVTFHETATTQIGLTSVATGLNSLTNIIDNNLITANWTSSDRGMSNAKSVLNAVNDPKRGKVVVMFTDGVPCRNQGSGSTFVTDVADGAISNSYDIKASGAKVYTVGIFDNPSTQTDMYMNFVSSNYPEAHDMEYTPYNGKPSTGSYYMTANDSDELSNIFTTIAEDISGGASTTLEESTVLKDVFETYCSIPSGTSGVTVKLAPCTGYSEADGYSWGAEIAAADSISVEVKTNTAGETYVDITGFDYSANWCGLTTSSTGSTPHGYKLVAYVDFKLDIVPNLETFDPIKCNGEDSGLYNGDEPVPGGHFENPTIGFGRIIIEQTGLKAGDSAIFKVTKDGAPLYDIVLTGNGSTTSTTIPLLEPMKTYTVTENNVWGWTYDTANSSQSVTFDENGESNGQTTVTLTFNHTPNAYPMNEEKTIKNKLK